MKSALSAEKLSGLIGGIYDCAVDPSNWEPVLQAVCTQFSFANAIIALLTLPDGRPALQASVGVAQDWLALLPALGPEVVSMWGGPERIMSFAVGEPVVASQAIDVRTIDQNRYYREWIEPQGFSDAIVIVLARAATMHGSVGFNRHRSVGSFTDDEVNGMRLLAPHFCRAVAISKLFDMKSVETAGFVSTLDRLTVGVVLVDADLSIVHANAAGEEMLAARDPIISVNGRVTLGNRVGGAALDRAVADAAGNLSASGQIGIPATRASGEPCVIHVLPLGTGELRRDVARGAVAALFIAPAEVGAVQLPRDALALLYDLTPAEARVFELVAQGKTQVEIGQALGVARSTVKSHLLSIFAKTGRKRQLDLVRLAERHRLPI
jgi:DNA-binding CsgD family transcriptional regulator